MVGGGVSREEVTFELRVLLVGKLWKRCSLGKLHEQRTGSLGSTWGRREVPCSYSVIIYIWGEDAQSWGRKECQEISLHSSML